MRMPLLYRSSRPRFLVPGSVLLALALLLSAACQGGDDASGDGGSTDGSPLKIGVILSYSGPFGLYGQPMESVMRLYFEQHGNEIAGRPVEFVFEDDGTDAGTAVTKAKKLVEQDKVHLVVCCVNGASTLAVSPILAETRTPQIGPIPNPAGLEKYDTAAMAAPTAGTDATKLGRYAYEKLGYREVVVIASDFSYGHEVAAGFMDGFRSAGGKVAQQIYPPLGTQDYGSFLTQVGQADAVFAGLAGADAIRFVQQYQQFGLKDRMPLVGHGPLVTELVLSQIGEPGVGVKAAFYYTSSLDNPSNAAFLKAVSDAGLKIIPSHFTAGAWATAQVISAAVEQSGGNVSDGAKLAEAIRSTEIDAPWGRLTFDPETGYAVTDTYFYEVVKEGGQIKHRVIDQIR